jgi:hypothetical protein
MMFTIYKKIISPETSPVLGPATPRESQTVDGSSIDIQSPKMQSIRMPSVQSMEQFSLCDCCSTRTKTPQSAQQAQSAQSTQPAQPEKPDSVYEFNHATHYTYNATTPRMVWEFDINIKPTPKH